MVQYVLTPWRVREELLLVKRQFYVSPLDLGTSYSEMSKSDDSSSSSSSSSEVDAANDDDNDNDNNGDSSDESQDQDGEGGGGGPAGGADKEKQMQRQQLRQAVARVSMWMQRGNCPHMVESTALLTAAMLSDEDADMAVDNAASAAYAVRAAYAAAFSRFVTGLLDGHQDKQRKQSMYSVAKTIGLPATFVELRHQSTHEQLPSLAKLRISAKKALAWIWDYYWKHLTGDDTADPSSRIVPVSASNTTPTVAAEDPCENALLRYLKEGDDGEYESRRRRKLIELRQWDTERLLQCLNSLQGRLLGNQAYLKCRRLAHELKEIDEHGSQNDKSVDESYSTQTAVVSRIETHGGNTEPQISSSLPPQPSPGSESDTGWTLYQGPWKPKPIGMI